MKKTISILLLVLLIAGVFISCDNKVKATSSETVSVSFVESSSKDLTVTHDTLTLTQLYWKYAARKSLIESSMADGTGLSQGQTDGYDEDHAKWIKPTTSQDGTIVPSAAGYGVVGGFSQGLWDFKLFGYTKDGDAYKLVVEGEKKNVSLVFGGPNAVSVKVAPVSSSGRGTLTFDNISFVSDKSGESGSRSYNVEVTKVPSGDHGGDVSGNVYTLDPGEYKATISYSIGDYTFATGTKLVQVWSNQNTTISGNLNELITSSDFGATIDPLVLFASTDTATNTAINKYQGISKLTYTDNNDSPKLKLEIPSEVAQSYIYNYTDRSSSSKTPNADDQINFTASVETTAISDKSVTYNIALDYSVKPNYASIFQGPTEITKITDYKVGTSNDLPAVTITLFIDKNLTSCSVTGLPSKTSAQLNNAYTQGYNYDSTSGQLKINIKSLGSFVVSYSR